MKTIAIIQARQSSTRLPGKALMDLAGKPVIARVVAAAQAIPGIDKAVVATTDQPADDALAAWCAANNVPCHRGSEEDVLDRFLLAARAEQADIVIRLTGDCPLLDPWVAGSVVALRAARKLDYASNIAPATWPDGLDCEVFTRAALESAAAEANRPMEREHVTPYLRDNRHRFRQECVIAPLPGLQAERWTLDEDKDFEFLAAVLARLPAKAAPPSWMEVWAVLEANPDLRDINRKIVRNAGFAKTLRAEKAPAWRGAKVSGELLKRAEKVIPLGSQTFSKSHIQYPAGAPMFLTHGQGGRVWDVDGNCYVDLVSGLLPVVLGYQDPDVDQAIRSQLNNGISLSLATELETELAERLVEIIPCAEAVRFGKNGTDATSAAIRLARAFTGRDRVIACGYHGWQDWYIGATVRHKGVPGAVRELTHMAPYGDLDALLALFKAHPGEIAALIMEPMNAVEPSAGYLEQVKDIVHAHGALLVFDEVITGFRYALGGAQSLFGVTPDLASFGKAMGNGMPISAVVGRADILHEMENIFFSGTFGGETLSLAASIAVIDKMKSEPVIERLWQMGEVLATETEALAAKHGLSDVVSMVGKAPWKIFAFKPHPQARVEAMKTLFSYHVMQNGVLLLASHNLCYAHTEDDLGVVLRAYDTAFGRVAEELATGKLEERLPCKAVEPIFKVR
ncbi:MAG: aminotransferase class III-fold pyridoxal phosphate-dependent enzyme [Alphaproteobacteria bacterium]|nr:aminotransferase class III-fold pyridoxal phosphate-dependent enzyme [Alphaproteobacteria bacterium]